MADSYHIIDGKVVPYCGGRKCNDTDAWRDATQLELQLQEQLEEYEHTIATLQDEVERLVWEIEALREEAEQHLQQAMSNGSKARVAQSRAGRLAEALRELVDVFSESGMYDEEVFDKARDALEQEPTT